MSIIRDGFQSADLDAPVITPTLNLDFANSQELDPRITFSRGSIGTFVNKNGLIETAPANQPRFDYDPVTGECKGLLIEESRTNLFTYSNLSQTTPTSTPTGWNGFNPATCLTSQTLSPNGIEYGVFHGAINQNGGGLRKDLTSLSANTTYTVSFWAKKVNRTELTYFVYNNGRGQTTGGPVDGGKSVSWFSATKVSVNVDNINGTGASISSGNLSNLSDNWQRFSATVVSDSAGSIRIVIANNVGDVGTGNEDGGGVFLIWGAQLEAGSFPTSYIPTTTSSVTRSADNADMKGSNFTSWANSSVGTFVIRGRGGQSTSQTLRGRFIGLDASAGAISLEGASTKVSIWDNTNNVVVTNNSADVVNRNSNIAASFDGTLRRIVLNGVASSGISRRNINTIFTQISLGKNGNNSNYLNGTLSRVAYYPRQLNDAQMLYLTT